MNGFFKPLRRKIGVITLVVACVVTAAWVRSYIAEDKAHIPFQTSIRIISTSRGCLHYCYANCDSPASVNRSPQEVSLIEVGKDQKKYVILYYNAPRVVRWKTSGKVATDAGLSTADPQLKQWNALGITCAVKQATFDHPDGTIKETIEFHTVPYWSIVIPLTVLSAWLLLSQARVVTAKCNSLS